MQIMDTILMCCIALIVHIFTFQSLNNRMMDDTNLSPEAVPML